MRRLGLLIVAFAAVVLVAINPELVLWAVAGVSLGFALSIVRYHWATRRDQEPERAPLAEASTEIDRNPARAGGMRRSSRLVLLVDIFLSSLAFVVVGLQVSNPGTGPPTIVVRADYVLSARLDTATGVWAIDEQYTFGPEAVAEVLRKRPPDRTEDGMSPEEIATYLGAELAPEWQWGLDTGSPVLRRSRTSATRISSLATSTDTIDVSELRASGFDVVPSSSSVAHLAALPFTIVRTSPPEAARDPFAQGGEEVIDVPTTGDAITVQVANGVFASEALIPVTRFSAWWPIDLAVGAVVAAITSAFGSAVWGRLKTVVGRGEKPKGKRRRVGPTN
jgi:hypothetical protein